MLWRSQLYSRTRYTANRIMPALLLVSALVLAGCDGDVVKPPNVAGPSESMYMEPTYNAATMRPPDFPGCVPPTNPEHDEMLDALNRYLRWDRGECVSVYVPIVNAIEQGRVFVGESTHPTTSGNWMGQYFGDPNAEIAIDKDVFAAPGQLFNVHIHEGTHQDEYDDNQAFANENNCYDPAGDGI